MNALKTLAAALIVVALGASRPAHAALGLESGSLQVIRVAGLVSAVANGLKLISMNPSKDNYVESLFQLSKTAFFAASSGYACAKLRKQNVTLVPVIPSVKVARS